jgi:hypothetical protein
MAKMSMLVHGVAAGMILFATPLSLAQTNPKVPVAVSGVADTGPDAVLVTFQSGELQALPQDERSLLLSFKVALYIGNVYTNGACGAGFFDTSYLVLHTPKGKATAAGLVNCPATRPNSPVADSCTINYLIPRNEPGVYTIVNDYVGCYGTKHGQVAFTVPPWKVPTPDSKLDEIVRILEQAPISQKEAAWNTNGNDLRSLEPTVPGLSLVNKLIDARFASERAARLAREALSILGRSSTDSAPSAPQGALRFLEPLPYSDPQARRAAALFIGAFGLLQKDLNDPEALYRLAKQVEQLANAGIGIAELSEGNASSAKLLEIAAKLAKAGLTGEELRKQSRIETQRFMADMIALIPKAAIPGLSSPVGVVVQAQLDWNQRLWTSVTQGLTLVSDAIQAGHLDERKYRQIATYIETLARQGPWTARTSADFVRKMLESIPAAGKIVKVLWGMPFAQEVFAGKGSGDVHIEMLNGVRYDFQAVGEFIALKIQNQVKVKESSLEIQVRQQPYGNSRMVSVTTALAMNVDGDSVGLYAGQPVPLRVNHQPMSLHDAVIPLSHGGKIQRQDNGFVVIRPDTSQVRILLYGSYLDYIVTVVAPPENPMGGLFGTGDATPENSLAPRHGPAVPLPGLYNVFGDSWRISQRESLFDYEKDQTTKTFIDLKFPYQSDPVTGLTEAQRQNAEAICQKAGISDRVPLAECILDVAVTGDSAFAERNARTEAAYAKLSGPEFKPDLRFRRWSRTPKPAQDEWLKRILSRIRGH